MSNSSDKGGMETLAIPEEKIRQYEKRRSSRQPFVCQGLLYRDDRTGTAGPQRVDMKDISRLGLGFDSTQAVEAGTRCRVKMELGPTRIAWRLRVVCCGRIDENLYRIGCEFIALEPPLFDLEEREATLGTEEQM